MKIAVITGGNRGLGKNAALHLAKDGVDVIFTYRSHRAEADAVVKEIKALGRNSVALELDVGRSSTFKAFADTIRSVLKENWGTERFDFLINNAGMGYYAPLSETTEEAFDDLVNVHFKGTYFLTQKLVPLMNDGGRIINLSSGLARFSYPGSSAYASMKGAVEVLTRYMAVEFGARGITANIVAPGAIETDFGGGHVRDNKELNAMISARTPLGRVGQPDDIGGVIAGLCRAENGWVNGQRIEASGGIHI